MKQLHIDCRIFRLVISLPPFHPSSTRWFSKELNVTFISFLINSLCWMIAYQTWPPRMSFEFGPKYSAQFNFCRRRIWTLSVRLLQGSFALWRGFFFSADWRKAFCSFFRWIVLLLICCFAANGRRRLLRFWCFSKIGEESRHVYLFDRFTHVNNFPAFLTPTKRACPLRISTWPQTPAASNIESLRGGVGAYYSETVRCTKCFILPFVTHK